MINFRALVTEEVDGKYISTIKTKSKEELPEGEVLVNVKYSSLNYKDGLSSIGNKGVTRNYPHTPGIDAAGVVAESSDSGFQKGEEVIITGYDLGMNTSGGYSEYVRIPAGWVVKKPEGLSMKESMIYGTAGFTAALSIIKLEEAGIRSGKVLVTGATGGVGSVAVAMLAKLGYEVVAVTGKADKADFLKKLGASEITSREEADDKSKSPMLKGVYAGLVDTVGGNILASALKKISYGGVATTCGLTQSPDLNTSVFPFILRAISLFGIDSAELPINLKEQTWQRIATDLKIENIASLSEEISLEKLIDYLPKILKGQTSGRVVIKI